MANDAWLNEVIAEVRNTAGVDPPGHELPRRPVRLCAVSVAPGRDIGWFLLQKRLNAAEVERIAEGFLAPGGEPEKARYDILDVVMEDDGCLVRVLATAPQDGLVLLLPRVDQARMLTAVADGLERGRASTLVANFARRQLDPVASHPMTPIPSQLFDGLSVLQSQALRACLGSGLQVVWGPPGTGKTHVIALALTHLITTRTKCLLVSSTNIVVDNAVDSLLKSIKPPAGSVVRVGTPHLKTLAENTDVTLTGLVALRQQADRAAMAALQAEAERLHLDGADRRLQQALRVLDEYGGDSYQGALDREENAREIAEAESAHEAASRAAGNAHAASARALHQLLAVRLLDARQEENAIHGEVDENERRLRAVLENPGRWWGRRNRRASATEIRDEAMRRWTMARDRVAQMKDELAARGPIELTVKVPTQPAERRALIADLKAHTDAAAASARELETRLEVARHRVTAASAKPLPSDGTRELLRRAQAARVPEVLKALPQLRDDEKRARKRSEEITAKHDELHAKAKRERTSLERHVVDEATIIATTLTQLATRAAMTDQSFDTVLVDEAAAARLPDVMLAVAHARRGATLLGDYLQNRPIAPEGAGNHAIWKTEVFDHFELTRTKEAQTRRGCVVLTEQRRFGGIITDFINEIAYDGVLEPLPSNKPSKMVLVDVDGLPESLTTIHRSGTYKGAWAIGSMLSHALAKHHRAQGQTVGVVVPYREQADATEDFMREQSDIPIVEVGTSHAFQGREFDVVIFDLVEDGRGRFRDADIKSTKPFNRDSVRVMNVAVTRARQRVYLIANGAAIERAKAGPLAVLRRKVESGGIERACTTDYLDREPQELQTAAANDVRIALDSIVRVIGVHDEVSLPPRLIESITQADRSVALWSPWVGSHTGQLKEALIGAEGRACLVLLVTRPGDKITTRLETELNSLRGELSHVIQADRMHEKLAVLDGHHIFIGSMNMLSYASTPAQRTLEVMLEIKSKQLAGQLLEQQKLSSLLPPPACPLCGVTFESFKTATQGDKRARKWACQMPGCNGSQNFVDTAE